MAGGRIYQDEEAGPITDINITPMVDVMLVLLIIFMVTARLISGRGIPIDLSQTRAGAPVNSPMRVSIDKKLVLYLNGIAYSDREQLKGKIAAQHAAEPELRAVVEADRDVPHGEVMQLIDLVKDAGVSKFSLASKPLTELGGTPAPGP